MRELNGRHLTLVPEYIEPESSDIFFDTEYAESLSDGISEQCVKFGLNPKFVEIFKTHLNDLHLVITPGCFSEDEDEACLSVKMSRYKQSQEDKTDWVRQVVVSNRAIKTRAKLLNELLDKVAPGSAPTETEDKESFDESLKSAALEWIFCEQAITALGNSCFMQRRFGTYINDLNGQSPHYRAGYTLSAVHLNKNIDDVKGSLAAENPIAEDFKNMRLGFGLLMLHQILLAHKIVDHENTAEELIEQIRILLPDAFDSREIEKRIRGIKPDGSFYKRLLELSIATFDEELVDLEADD